MHLPTGRAGQALAVLLLLVVLATAWAAVAAPLRELYLDRAASLELRRALARRMTQIADTLPTLQRGSPAAVATPVPVLDGITDAVAGAELQQLVQDKAARGGAVLSSAEVLPAEPAGAYRRIGLRIAVNAPWPVLVGLLRSIDGVEVGAEVKAEPKAAPALTVDDLQLHGSRGFIRDKAAPLEASWTVLAFRPAGPP